MKNSIKYVYFVFLMSALLISFTETKCIAYGTSTHTWIALQSLRLVDNPDLQNSSFTNEIVIGAWKADFTFYDEDEEEWTDIYALAMRDHFYNPDTGEAACFCRAFPEPCWTAKAKGSIVYAPGRE